MYNTMNPFRQQQSQGQGQRQGQSASTSTTAGVAASSTSNLNRTPSRSQAASPAPPRATAPTSNSTTKTASIQVSASVSSTYTPPNDPPLSPFSLPLRVSSTRSGDSFDSYDTHDTHDTHGTRFTDGSGSGSGYTNGTGYTSDDPRPPDLGDLSTVLREWGYLFGPTARGTTNLQDDNDDPSQHTFHTHTHTQSHPSSSSPSGQPSAPRQTIAHTSSVAIPRPRRHPADTASFFSGGGGGGESHAGGRMSTVWNQAPIADYLRAFSASASADMDIDLSDVELIAPALLGQLHSAGRGVGIPLRRPGSSRSRERQGQGHGHGHGRERSRGQGVGMGPHPHPLAQDPETQDTDTEGAQSVIIENLVDDVSTSHQGSGSRASERESRRGDFTPSVVSVDVGNSVVGSPDVDYVGATMNANNTSGNNDTSTVRSQIPLQPQPTGGTYSPFRFPQHLTRERGGSDRGSPFSTHSNRSSPRNPLIGSTFSSPRRPAQQQQFGEEAYAGRYHQQEWREEHRRGVTDRDFFDALSSGSQHHRPAAAASASQSLSQPLPPQLPSTYSPHQYQQPNHQEYESHDLDELELDIMDLNDASRMASGVASGALSGVGSGVGSGVHTPGYGYGTPGYSGGEYGGEGGGYGGYGEGGRYGGYGRANTSGTLSASRSIVNLNLVSSNPSATKPSNPPTTKPSSSNAANNDNAAPSSSSSKPKGGAGAGGGLKNNPHAHLYSAYHTAAHSPSSSPSHSPSHSPFRSPRHSLLHSPNYSPHRRSESPGFDSDRYAAHTASRDPRIRLLAGMSPEEVEEALLSDEGEGELRERLLGRGRLQPHPQVQPQLHSQLQPQPQLHSQLHLQLHPHLQPPHPSDFSDPADTQTLDLHHGDRDRDQTQAYPIPRLATLSPTIEGPSLGYLDEALNFIAEERARLDRVRAGTWAAAVGSPGEAQDRHHHRHRHDGVDGMGGHGRGYEYEDDDLDGGGGGIKRDTIARKRDVFDYGSFEDFEAAGRLGGDFSSYRGEGGLGMQDEVGVEVGGSGGERRDGDGEGEREEGEPGEGGEGGENDLEGESEAITSTPKKRRKRKRTRKKSDNNSSAANTLALASLSVKDKDAEGEGELELEEQFDRDPGGGDTEDVEHGDDESDPFSSNKLGLATSRKQKPKQKQSDPEKKPGLIVLPTPITATTSTSTLTGREKEKGKSRSVPATPGPVARERFLVPGEETSVYGSPRRDTFQPGKAAPAHAHAPGVNYLSSPYLANAYLSTGTTGTTTAPNTTDSNSGVEKKKAKRKRTRSRAGRSRGRVVTAGGGGGDDVDAEGEEEVHEQDHVVHHSKSTPTLRLHDNVHYQEQDQDQEQMHVEDVKLITLNVKEYPLEIPSANEKEASGAEEMTEAVKLRKEIEKIRAEGMEEIRLATEKRRVEEVEGETKSHAYARAQVGMDNETPRPMEVQDKEEKKEKKKKRKEKEKERERNKADVKVDEASERLLELTYALAKKFGEDREFLVGVYRKLRKEGAVRYKEYETRGPGMGSGMTGSEDEEDWQEEDPDPRGRDPRRGERLVHVFIDHSNILIGLLNYARKNPRLFSPARAAIKYQQQQQTLAYPPLYNPSLSLLAPPSVSVSTTTSLTTSSTIINPSSGGTSSRPLPPIPVKSNPQPPSSKDKETGAVPTPAAITLPRALLSKHQTQMAAAASSSPIPLPSFATAAQRLTLDTNSSSKAGRSNKKAAAPPPSAVSSVPNEKMIEFEGAGNVDSAISPPWPTNRSTSDDVPVFKGTRDEQQEDAPAQPEFEDDEIEDALALVQGHTPHKKKHSKRLWHAALALILEHGRPITRRVCVASKPLWQPMETLERLDYEVRIYLRVPDLGDGMDRQAKRNSNGTSRKSTTAFKAFNVHRTSGSTSGDGGYGATYTSSSGNEASGTKAVAIKETQKSGAKDSSLLMEPSSAPASTLSQSPRNQHLANVVSGYQVMQNQTIATSGGKVKYREQGVDELLQLKLHQAIAATDDVPEGSTIVLATGDGNVGQFNEDGFLGPVRTALRRGWKVELYAWEEGLSRAWRKEFGPGSEWERNGRFRIVGMEQFATWLLKDARVASQ